MFYEYTVSQSSNVRCTRSGALQDQGTWLYTEERKVRIKTVVVSLWFDMAHLTDSLLEAVRVAIVAGRAFHSTTAKGKNEFVVVSPSVNLPICQWVGNPNECGSRGWRMKGAALQHIHVLFYKKGPLASQQAAAQGYTSRDFLAY